MKVGSKVDFLYLCVNNKIYINDWNLQNNKSY